MQFIQNNFWLVMLAAVSGAMLVWPLIGRRLSGAKEVDTLQATQLMNHKDALVLDVREQQEWTAGHIPGAKHMPAGTVAGRIKELDKYKDKPIIVLCAHGNRSASACSQLAKSGFTEVVSLKGGISAWETAGLPVSRKK